MVQNTQHSINLIKFNIMKKYLLILFTLIFMVIAPCKAKTDIAKEEAAIKAVIEGEIKASFDGDYVRWTTFFVQEPYTVWMQAWKQGYACWKGWQEISTSAKNFIKPERKGSITFIGNYDYTIKIYDKAAFVSFKCKSTSITEGQNRESDAMEVRFLENHDGNWKISYLSSIYLSTYK